MNKVIEKEVNTELRGAPVGERRRSGIWLFKQLRERYALVAIWACLAIIWWIILPTTFPTHATFVTIFGSQSVLVILALSVVGTLTAGELDLSVASTMGLSATIVAVLNGQIGLNIGIAIIAALAASVLVGITNALLVVRAGVDSMVVTLGMSTLLLGIALWISNVQTISGVDKGLTALLNDHFLGLPRSFWIAMIVVALVWYLMRHTPVGRHLLFVGRGRDASRLAGLRVDSYRAGAFIGGALIAGLAGLILVGSLGAFQANTSVSFLLPAFAAAFLGSTVVEPGRFNAWGSTIAIYFLVTGITGLTMLGFSGWIEQVFYGAALVLAALVSTVVRKRLRRA